MSDTTTITLSTEDYNDLVEASFKEKVLPQGVSAHAASGGNATDAYSLGFQHGHASALAELLTLAR